MYLGIDLGTSNSAVVGYHEGSTRLFKTSDGSDVLPSVIYLDKRGHRFVGKSAQDRILTAPKNVASGFKRLMGTNSPISLGDQTWTPEQCSAEIIRTLVGQAVTESGISEINGTVVTIPAAFNQMQSEATITAAREAGLQKVSLLQEPVAAAMASISHTKQKDGVFLVYDLGGGTFDVALVLSTAGSVNVIAHEGINMLGGRDFDRIIFDSLIRPWLSKNFSLPAHFQKEPRYRHLSDVARFAIERAKIQLSVSEEASVFASEDEVRIVDEAGEEIYISLDISRRDVEELIEDRIKESVDLCRKIIAENGYKHEDISRVVPIGGPSKMPIVRRLLQNELAIDVEQGLDPMTAVATGAAIFAESREWDGEKSSRKSARRTESVSGKISLSFDYRSRVSDATTRLRIKPEGSPPPGFDVEVTDEEGATSGKKPIDGLISLTLILRRPGENRFRVRVSDPMGLEVTEASRDITIVRTEASAASIPMTYTLAVKTLTGTVGYERNELQALLEKGTALPAEGRQIFRAGKTLRGGEDDFIAFEFFEMAKGVKDPEFNLHIGDFRLSAAHELERGERIERGDELTVHWKMSDNGTLNFAVEIPKLGRLIDAHNLYLAPAGHVNFEGQQGSEIAATLLSRAERDLESLEETVGDTADPTGAIRKRLERQHAALSTSIDADTHRSVAEEARRLRQEIALLRLSPKNEQKVLSREVEDAELEFDQLRESATAIDSDRYEKLLVTARRSLREGDYDAVRHAADEMRTIRFKVLSESPEFLLSVLRQLAEEKHLALDGDLHDQLVSEAIEAAKSGDIQRIRFVIRKMIANRTQDSTKAEKIVELAHLLGA